MKKLITWVCIISLILLVLFYVVSASSAAENSDTEIQQAARAEAYAVIDRARDMVTNQENGLEALVRSGTSLLGKGAAWEPLARKKLHSAALLAGEIEKMLAPYLPPQGTSALRYINLGIGDRVIQKAEWAPYENNWSDKLPTQKINTKGNIVAGPRPHEGKLFWQIRFFDELLGWLPENILAKEFPHQTIITATACWIHGNVLTYKMVASLRSYQESEPLGERYAVVKDMLASIIAAYECALATFAHPDSIETIGVREAARYREIIKKNFPIMQEQQKQAQKQSSENRVGASEESSMIKAILGDEAAREKKSQQRMMVPPPDRESDPNRKFTPGVPIGIH
ncbi:MAG: hypothetical protein G01um101448_14 [Parcubacteria group bacterium Gr01-1014_48]|nr:MAG: hypothetical protein Greene041614_376 [Parcubacteria group bacterium Greene0416_14]TSC74599.1 MAG: hypothetical protein G01um101448_14 [Parcubacteria group bacterium Gr01-1014_48]TSD01602.1 MAG: hypothetical protein Greene101415_182 [Parcubacteria group bacterium Greene1014_15]TSD08349.1 MAG: hypothetical protein Greene07144_144 [Parcubacteria group bacterium Greene0714_4]